MIAADCSGLSTQAHGAGRIVRAGVGPRRRRDALARELFVTVATVKAHVSRLLSKLDVENRVQIALLVHDATSGPRPEP